jgi:hypothetical protein
MFNKKQLDMIAELIDLALRSHGVAAIKFIELLKPIRDMLLKLNEDDS